LDALNVAFFDPPQKISGRPALSLKKISLAHATPAVALDFN